MKLCSAQIFQEDYLVVFIFTNSNQNPDILKNLVKKEIELKLPMNYEPRRILILPDENIPVTSHGQFIKFLQL